MLELVFLVDKDLRTKGFSLESCRSMVNLMDVSCHGAWACGGVGMRRPLGDLSQEQHRERDKALWRGMDQCLPGHCSIAWEGETEAQASERWSRAWVPACPESWCTPPSVPRHREQGRPCPGRLRGLLPLLLCSCLLCGQPPSLALALGPCLVETGIFS